MLLFDILVVYAGELYVGGSFEEIDGVTVNGIARWNGGTWSDLDGGLTESGRGVVDWT